jgi:uncharacterized protein YodC (DUF2158 family)
MADFKVGDIVQLKSGAPKMTVVQEVNELMKGVRPTVFCSWFAGSRNEDREFPPDALILCAEAPGKKKE